MNAVNFASYRNTWLDTSPALFVCCWHVSDDEEGGKASRLCPGNSDVDPFGYGESVINLNAEIPDCALDLVIIRQLAIAERFAGLDYAKDLSFRPKA
jgi:hypothetical protein